jgi:hypothetical protein
LEQPVASIFRVLKLYDVTFQNTRDETLNAFEPIGFRGKIPRIIHLGIKFRRDQHHAPLPVLPRNKPQYERRCERCDEESMFQAGVELRCPEDISLGWDNWELKGRCKIILLP